MHRLLAPLLLLMLWHTQVQADVIRIAVAANFKPTLLNINRQFAATTGHEIKVTGASTGTIASQLMQGAPYDIFFAADKAAPQMISSNLSASEADFFCYAHGQLALVGGNGTLSQLADPSLSIAIANPVTAPYGRAAQEVLQRSEYASAKARKVVRGNNAIQAYQFWYTGSTALALVPFSLADQTAPQNTSTAAHVPTHWHQPIEQYAVVMRHSAAIDAYMNWFRSDTVQTLIEQAGYLPCP